MTPTAAAVSTDGDHSTGGADTARDWGWPVVVAAVLALAAVAWLYEGRGVTFFIDEWQWIIGRHSPSEASLLEPFNNHWMTVPIGIHQVLYRMFGIDSHLPYRLSMLAVHLTTAWLAFTYLRNRISKPLALAGCAVFAFYGYAWTITLWPISLGWAIATAAAVAAFLLVDRETRRADIAASVLLLVGVASTSVAVAFAIGLAAELAMRRAWRRLWIVVVPVVAYGAWFVSYGSGTSDYDSVGTIFRFVEALLAKTVATLVGLGPGTVDAAGREQVSTAAHVALAVAFIGFVAVWFMLGRPVTARLVGLITALAAYSAALAIARASATQGSYGVTTWYSYPAAVLLILAIGELFRGRVATPRWSAVIIVVAIWAVIWNIGEMRDGGDGLRRISRIERAQLLATDLSSDRVPGSFRPGAFLKDVTAGSYFKVEREYGTPAFTVAELRDAPLDARQAADEVIVRAMRIKAVPAAPEDRTAACVDADGQPVRSAVVLVEGTGARVGVFDRGGVAIKGAGGPFSRIDLPPLADPDARWIVRAQGGARLCTLPGSAGGLT